MVLSDQMLLRRLGASTSRNVVGCCCCCCCCCCDVDADDADVAFGRRVEGWSNIVNGPPSAAVPAPSPPLWGSRPTNGVVTHHGCPFYARSSTVFPIEIISYCGVVTHRWGRDPKVES